MTKLNTQYSIPNTKHVFAIILVGGKGKRLRPLSTDARPKAFLSITKDRKTMFKVTLDRIRKIIPSGNILVSANKAHARLIKSDFPNINKDNLIFEPVSRNTAPAIILAATLLKNRRGDAIMVVVPADQYIVDEKKYLDSIKEAISFAADNDSLVILALKPTYPATGFGYVKIKPTAQSPKLKASGIYKVEKFTEKPNLATARRFLKEGKYFWNAGAFVFGANSILKAISNFAPEIFSLVVQMNKTNRNRLYKEFPDISIDYAVMEKADNIYCVKGSYRWRDIGSFEALKEVLQKESRDFIEKKGKIIKII